MDIFYHFFVSLGLAVVFAIFLLAKSPRIRNSAPRFWQSEQRFMQFLSSMIVAISLVLAITFGIWKEWIDQLGFGRVEFSDFVADVLGVWVGVYLVIGRVRKEFKRRRRVSFHSKTAMRSSSINLFHQTHTLAHEEERQKYLPDQSEED